MKKFYSLFLAVVLIASITVGFIIEDPHGSKTMSSSNAKPNQYHSGTMQIYGTPVYTDNFDAANDTAALRTRGYKFYNLSTVPGTTSWFQGNATVFSAFNGPATGYLGANYNATASGNIDLWLVLPRISGGIQSGDSLIFYARSTDLASTNYEDSMIVAYSTSDSTPTGSWTQLSKFRVPKPPALSGLWYRFAFAAPTTSVNGRFALRYNVADGGPLGNNSDYIGVDAMVIERVASGVVNLNGEIPSSYSVSQNYPNPFNPTTKINFAIPKSGLVTMKVYDALGQEVATLVNDVKQAGNYTVDFNASALSSGIYFYKINVNGFNEVKRMMLIK